jgi:hypothetical protein
MAKVYLGVEYSDTDPVGTPGSNAVFVLNHANGKLWAPNNGVWTNIVGGANGVTTNSGSTSPSALDGSGTPTSSTPVPSTTPVVSALPTSGPLLQIGQMVIFQGQSYTYTLGISAGPDYWFLNSAAAPSISDTWANLVLYPASSYDLGAVFHATDVNVSYAVQVPGGTKTWIYFNGIWEDLLANKPTLGPTDVGLFFRASDYLHNWQWDGSAYSLHDAAEAGFGGGLPPGTVMFNVGSPPFGGTGSLWHACDGSTVNVSQENASVVSTILPTLTNGWYVR